MRLAHTYRYAKRNRAKALKLVWRRLRRIWLSTNQIMVDL